MSVTKYRSVELMPPVPRVVGADLADRIRAAWALARRLSGPLNTPGVQKFKTLEEAQRARQLAVIARVRRLRKQRQGVG